VRSLLIILLLSFGNQTTAQELSADVSKRDMRIGEPVTLTYKVKTDQNDTIVFFETYDEIPMRISNGGSISEKGSSAEILGLFKDTTVLTQGGSLWKGTYTVTIWDSGTFIIPGPKININDSTFRFDDLRIYCDYSSKKQGVDIYDIRENYAKLPPEESRFIRWMQKYWWAALCLLAAIGIVLWLIKRNRRSQPQKITKAMSLKDRTLAAIDALERERLWEQGKLKEHYIELSYILRSYLTARYHLSLLEKTTLEAKSLLLHKGLNEDTVDTIVKILSQSDMVKFAQSKPNEILILKVSTLARQIIAETSPLDFDNYE
jgi:hypothetical protein